MGFSKGLKITKLKYPLKKQNGVVRKAEPPALLSLNFDFKIWFRAHQVTGTVEKRAPEPKTKEYAEVSAT